MNLARLVALGPPTTERAQGWPGEGGCPPPTPAEAGFKAARLAAALRAGLPVLPGWVVPVREGRRAMAAGAAAVRAKGLAAGRVAVLRLELDAELVAELTAAVDLLGGQVIVRSSGPLEGDGPWAGAFSSVTGVGRDDVVTAVRSCWASAFAVDPLERLAECGLPPEALELGALVQPEIHPAAGGVARVTGGGARATVEGVRGHPGALLSGWAEGAVAEVALSPGSDRPAAAVAVNLRPGQARLTDLLEEELVEAVAGLAGRVWHILGDDMIEWAADGDGIWLLQSLRSGDAGAVITAAAALPGAGRGTSAPAGRAAAGAPLTSQDGMPRRPLRQGMPLLAAEVMRHGERIPGRPGAPGTAVGRLLACQPHVRPPGDCQDAILLVDRPVPALAPLLFAARGVIARTGAAGSHLAGVARSLGIPMVVGCRPEPVTGPPPVPGDRWLAAIDGSTGDVALLPAGQSG